MPDDEYKEIIAAIYRVTGAVEKRFDELRTADRETLRVLRLQLDDAQAAQALINAELKAMSKALERDFLTREYYDARHNQVLDQVNIIERWQYKLIGGLVMATFIAPLVTGVIVYLVTQQL